MKTVLRWHLVLILLVLAPVHSPARTYIVVRDSAIPAADQRDVDLFKASICDTNIPAGTRFVHVVSLGTRLETTANLVVPKLPYDSDRARRTALAKPIATVGKRVAELCSLHRDGSGVLLPAMLAHLRSLGIAGEDLSVLVVGSPFAKNEEHPRLDLLRWYPLDGVMDLPPEASRLGMAHLTNAFASLAVSWQIPVVDLATESQRRLQRYLTLAVARAGGRLVNWTTDAQAAAAAYLVPTNFTAEKFEVRAGDPARLRPYVAKALQTCGLDPALVSAIEELKKAGVHRCIAASWQVNADVDVLVDASVQFPGEREVYFARTNSAHLRFLGDRRKATGKGFEIVALDDAVEPERLSVWLELFQASEPARGEVVYFADDTLYRSNFAFDTADRGDEGLYRDARAGAPNWLRVRMSELLKQPVDE